MIIKDCFNFHGLILAAALVGGLANPAIAQERTYLIDLNSRTATELGSLDRDVYGLVGSSAMNDAGQIVGSYGGAPDHAFITGPNGIGLKSLGPFGDLAQTDSVASDVNNKGQVVGFFSSVYEYESHAFITVPDGISMRDLGTLSGTYSGHSFGSSASGINEAGQVVGGSETANGTTHAFITGPDGVGMRDLGTLGGDRSSAYAINNGGQVAGSSATADGATHAFITGPDGMGMRDLGTLGSMSSAKAINDAGQVVGNYHTAEAFDINRAFITGPDGMGMRDLGTLGGAYSFVFGMNDAGQVVGESSLGRGGPQHAFITGPDGGAMMDLNSLIDLPQGVTLIRAMDINDNGQVIADGFFTSASPVPSIPEPQSYALMLAGLSLIWLVAWRQKSGSRV
ncbi:PEP-CTERM protein-sorting domain-containing protein [Nitrosospira multiformis]|uniref:PEP-CTERM protein-sorting domain-containing protein n=1 Tax=Nitrosospira multiformis TaxID=1231 RepID=A0A1H8KGL4_9PROT|nr:HAF repeat-containing protein [Nitrosospira multiformis]SEN91957.1 PEP-CTERM protein-sorting domain-containing protein [Nitrosospira multiformis]